MFQERKPQKNKTIANWEKKEKVKKRMVDIIQKYRRHRLQVRAFLHQWRDGTQHGLIC
jgi:hypothetical protein